MMNSGSFAVTAVALLAGLAKVHFGLILHFKGIRYQINSKFKLIDS